MPPPFEELEEDAAAVEEDLAPFARIGEGEDWDGTTFAEEDIFCIERRQPPLRGPRHNRHESVLTCVQGYSRKCFNSGRCLV